VRALAEHSHAARAEIGAQPTDERRVTRLGREVGDPGRRVDVDEVRAERGERLFGNRLGEAAFERDEERPVVLVPVLVDHHDDPLEPGHDGERTPADELRVLERQLRRKERLRDTPGRVHREQAESPGEVRDEVEASVRELRLREDARREQRLDAVRGAGRQGS